mgnify:CR=1 FL=1
MRYIDVVIPEGKDPKKYTFIERRAEILRLILEAGHPKAITQTQLAKRYGKSQAMIHKDIEAIKHEIMECLNQDAEFTIYTLFNKVIRKGAASQNLKDNYLAAQAAKAWYEWLQDTGVKPKIATINQANIIGQVNQFQFNENAPLKEEWPKMKKILELKEANEGMTMEEAICKFLVEHRGIDTMGDKSFRQLIGG